MNKQAIITAFPTFLRLYRWQALRDYRRLPVAFLLSLVAMAGQGQTFTPVVEDSIDFVITGITTVKQDSIAIRTDSLCQRNVMCNHDTIRKDSCQQQHKLSFVRKEQRQAWSISPNAVKMQKFDPYRKKFTDMRIMETIGSHISR